LVVNAALAPHARAIRPVKLGSLVFSADQHGLTSQIRAAASK
jgi:hypothetical protein